MDVFPECFFENMLSQMEPRYLMVRYKRRQLVDRLNTAIKERARSKDCDEAAEVRRAVMAAIRYHANSGNSGERLCNMGRYHNILYIAVKLCSDWNLDDNSIVIQLLNNIFQCERTFERLFVGAIFGNRATHLISGWKSDFESYEENLAAIEYFLKHATKAKLEYDNLKNGKKIRFIDIPLESYRRATSARIAAEFSEAEVLLLLLRYGADMMTEYETDEMLTGQQSRQPFAFCVVSSYHLNQTAKSLACLKILLRTVSTMTAFPSGVVDLNMPFLVATRNALGMNKFYFHPRLLQEGIIPPSRSQLTPPELKHLSRCVIRNVLRDNWQLPLGIRSLKIPLSLQNYLDLLED